MKHDEKMRRGYSIIEALTVLFIFSLITVTFYSMYASGTGYIIDSRNRLGALTIANEKMEIVRNLEYDDIGIEGGIPSGSLQEEETVIGNNRNYTVNTFVQFVDDPFDGTQGGSPDDAIPEDYKRVKITATWNTESGSAGEVFLVSRFVPPGIEIGSGDGTLIINVIDSQGGGVPQATVRVVNNDISPAVDFTAQTDNTGNLMFPGANESNQKYEITVSKNNYETVNTMPPYPDTDYNPVDIHASVVTGSVNVKNVIGDKVSDIEFTSVDYLGNTVSGIDFKLVGGRILGNEVDPPNDPIYNMDTEYQTDAEGERNLDSISPGEYTFELANTETDYELAGVSYVSPFSLLPDEALEFEIEVADKDFASLLVRVKNNDDQSPINGADVRLTDGGTYDETLITEEDGNAFFPVPPSEDPLTAGTYTLEVEAEGFQDVSDNTTISSDELKVEEVMLMPE